MSKKQTKTREQKLKGTSVYREGLVCTKRKGETWKEADERNDYFKQQGIEKGKQIREDEIMKIIDDMPVDKRHICGTYGIHIIPKGCSGIVTEWERIDKQDLKQKIKGDEK